MRIHTNGERQLPQLQKQIAVLKHQQRKYAQRMAKAETSAQLNEERLAKIEEALRALKNFTLE